MARERLSAASELVEEAAERATDDDHAARLTGLAEQLDTLATRDRAPDHGRLARLLNALGEVEDEAGEPVGERIEAARDEISEFRKTIEGV